MHMEGTTGPFSEYAVIRSLRRFRDKYFSSAGKLEDDLTTVADTDAEDHMPCFLDVLPVNVQFLIMTLLSPPDICRLGATSCYWRDVVRDPLLWRYFLQRDMPHWSSIDHMSMPQLQYVAGPLCSKNVDKIYLDEVEDGDQGKEPQHDYMAEYLKGCPAHRQRWRPLRPPYEAVASFLQSLVPSSEPRYAMFGPGMEQLDVSLVTRLMHSPDILPVAVAAGVPPRQINGVGSGISFMYNNQYKFNILTLYSTNRAERERARVEQRNVSNKLFTFGGTDQSGCPVFSSTPQVQEVCQAVDGFIYVANAEPGRGEGELEGAQIQAVLSPAWGLSSRPLLVLSCVSREERDTVMATSPASSSTSTGPIRASWRTPCVEVAHRLGLPQLPNPWMVQDIVAESLSGLLDGVSWLLKCSGVRLQQQLAD